MIEIMNEVMKIDKTEVEYYDDWGERYVVKFPNGYGASVIQNEMSYGHQSGLWELAVLHNEDLCYRTPITDDVIGWLSPEDVRKLIEDIYVLPENKYCVHYMKLNDDEEVTVN